MTFVLAAPTTGCTRPLSTAAQVSERPLRTVSESVRAPDSRPTLTAAFERSTRPDGRIELRVHATWLDTCDHERKILVERTSTERDEEPDRAGNILAMALGGAMLGGGALALGYFGTTLPSRAEDCRPDAADSSCFDPAANAVGVGATLAVAGGLTLGAGLYGLHATPRQHVAVSEEVVETNQANQPCGATSELEGVVVGLESMTIQVADARLDATGAATLVLPARHRAAPVIVRHVPEHLRKRLVAGDRLGWTAMVGAAPSTPRTP